MFEPERKSISSWAESMGLNGLNSRHQDELISAQDEMLSAQDEMDLGPLPRPIFFMQTALHTKLVSNVCGRATEIF